MPRCDPPPYRPSSSHDCAATPAGSVERARSPKPLALKASQTTSVVARRARETQRFPAVSTFTTLTFEPAPRWARAAVRATRLRTVSMRLCVRAAPGVQGPCAPCQFQLFGVWVYYPHVSLIASTPHKSRTHPPRGAGAGRGGVRCDRSRTHGVPRTGQGPHMSSCVPRPRQSDIRRQCHCYDRTAGRGLAGARTGARRRSHTTRGGARVPDLTLDWC